VVLHPSFLLMNSFNITEAAIFSCRLCFPRAFPFISFVIRDKFLTIQSNNMQHFQALFKHLFLYEAGILQLQTIQFLNLRFICSTSSIFSEI